MQLETLVSGLIKDYVANNKVIYSDDNKLPGGYVEAQINAYMTNCTGISIRGNYQPKRKTFKMEYCFPFLDGREESTEEEISVERQTDKEAYLALCDEPKRGIAIIFFVKNIVEYMNTKPFSKELKDVKIRLSALASDGVILLPVSKTDAQLKKYIATSKSRDNLVELARKGDSSAIDSLTIEDLDTYSSIFKRIKNEDVFTIVDTSLMPTGFECDNYQVVGNIMDCRLTSNSYTGEEFYCMSIECNDLIFDMCINKNDLIGEPKIGRRFKGHIWLQGQFNFDN